MRDDRIGGWALVGGTLMGLVTMALHPTGRDLLEDYDRSAPLVVASHAIAIAALPLMLVGALALRRRLAAAGSPGLAEGGLAAYAVATVAVLNAGVASGLIGPMIARRLLESEGVEAGMARTLFAFNGMVNHGFAFVYVGLAAAAIALWSWAGWRTRALPRALAALGLAVGGALVAITLAGRLRLDVHHFGMVVAAMGAWTAWTGGVLIRRDGPAS